MAIAATFTKPHFMTNKQIYKKTAKCISLSKIAELTPELAEKYITLDSTATNDKDWKNYQQLSNDTYKTMSHGQKLMMTLDQKMEHVREQIWNCLKKTIPTKLMDVNTLQSDSYHNRISTKVFKMEWNIRRILKNLAEGNPSYQDTETCLDKLEKIAPDIQWRLL